MIIDGLSVDVENPELFDEALKAAEGKTALPVHLNLDLLETLVGRASVALIHASQQNKPELLRGLFSDDEVARLANHPVHFEDAVPKAVTIRVLGVEVTRPPHSMRIRITIDALNPPEDLSVMRQFWDIALATSVTVSERMLCLRCGAPMEVGQLICGHCGADEEAQITPPAVVAKVQFY